MEYQNLKKTNQVILLIGLVIVALYFGAGFFIPLAFAVLFSTLVLPVANFVENKWNFGRTLSSFLCTLLIFITIGAFLWLLIQQLAVFVNDVVERKDDILDYVKELQVNIARLTGFETGQQKEMVEDNTSALLNVAQNFITSLLEKVSGALGSFFLMLVYVFLLLLYRAKMFKFIMMYVSDEEKDDTAKVIEKTSKVAHHFLWGRIKVIILLAIMYTITFTSYGLEHAGMLILFASMITIIPYFGPMLSGVLPVLFIIIYGNSMPVIISFAAIVLAIQLVESYIMEPIIIGSEVQQNPLFVIVAIILGGAIWGLPGLILFVPLFAILKIIFDHSKYLQPVGYLIGYEKAKSGNKWLEKIKSKFKKDSD